MTTPDNDRQDLDRTAYSDEPTADATRTTYSDEPAADVSGDALDRPINGDSYERPAAEADTAPEMNSDDPLVPDDLAVDFKARWDVIQQGFVDDPRTAVSEADKLVDDVLKRLSDTFEQQHQSLEGQWADGEPSTEDLRGALQRYRTFFQRLVTL